MARLQSWWQKAKKPLLVGGIIVACALGIALIVGIIGGYLFHWSGTGVTQKTLWDWMQLLIVPVVLTVGAFFFNLATSRNEQKIALDSQQETLLQAHLDRMSELLLDKHLMEETNNKVLSIARARTLTVLSRLDPARKGNLVQFLQEAGLIKRHKGIREDDRTIIDMRHADSRNAYFVEASLLNTRLSYTNLIKANLSRAYMTLIDISYANLSEADLTKAFITYADLSGANLTRANLRDCNLYRSNLGMVELDEKPTNLTEANLTRADLTEADLTGANLNRANLTEANFTRANLENANLKEANLSEADLRAANLTKAEVTEEQLNQAKSLKGATMPDGSKHP